MNRKPKKRSGDRITGCLEPFGVDDLQSVYQRIIRSRTVPVQQLNIFRENSKVAVALRMRPAVDMNIPNVVISSKSLEVITEYLNEHQHRTDVGFVICTLRYFSGEKTHSISLNLNCSCCNSKDPDKSLAHARMDCYKFSKIYVGGILRKLKTDSWSNLNTNETRDLYIQYQSIDYSIKFVCEYLVKLCKGKLPKELGANVFTRACSYDLSLANHYNHDACLDIYRLNTKANHSLTTLNQECATYIFCTMH